jgi:hypothetical protein
MRITVIVEDKTVIIDGESYSDIDMSSISPSIHAIQWYGDYGFLEIVDNDSDVEYDIIDNVRIESFQDYRHLIKLWEAKKAEQNKVVKNENTFDMTAYNDKLAADTLKQNEKVLETIRQQEELYRAIANNVVNNGE